MLIVHPRHAAKLAQAAPRRDQKVYATIDVSHREQRERGKTYLTAFRTMKMPGRFQKMRGGEKGSVTVKRVCISIAEGV